MTTTKSNVFVPGDWILTGGNLTGYLLQPFGFLDPRRADPYFDVYGYGYGYGYNKGEAYEGTGWDAFITGYSSPSRIMQTHHCKKIGKRWSTKLPEWIRPGRVLEEPGGVTCKVVAIRGQWALVGEADLKSEFDLFNWFFTASSKDPEGRYHYGNSPFVGIYKASDLCEHFDLCFTRHEKAIYNETVSLAAGASVVKDFGARGRNLLNLDLLGV